MTTRTEKLAAKNLDRLIERIYRQNCSGITIDMLDIGKVFAEGRKAAAEGRDLKEAIVTFVETIRKN
jgi:hypothetical protein